MTVVAAVLPAVTVAPLAKLLPDTVIEVGPHPTQLTNVAEVGSGSPPLTLPSLRRGEPERAFAVAFQ